MKILLVTPYFPSLDIQYADPRTKFLYYYALQWLDQDCEIMVLHSVPRYPRIFSVTISFLEKRMGLDKIRLSKYCQKKEAVEEKKYRIKGIEVIRIPINKIIPHRDYLSRELKRHRLKIMLSLSKSNFKPDVVISDFIVPSIYIAKDICDRFDIPFFQIIHQVDINYFRNNKSYLYNILKTASGVLYRSYPLANIFKKEGFVGRNDDYIFSGIPNETVFGKKRTSVKKLLFVGSLRKTKNLHIVLKAIAASKRRNQYTMEIVGDGPYEKDLKLLVKKLGLEGKVNFYGKLSREGVFEKMRDSDCLIMVSRESFGMVYVEALSQGCIVLAAKGQGIDGIIVNGNNGFLIDLGSTMELSELLDELAIMPIKEIENISENALLTAKDMTDGELAKRLLEKLKKHNSGHILDQKNC